MRIILIDDDLNIRRAVVPVLKGMGHDVVAAANSRSAMQELEKDTFDVALLDENSASDGDIFPAMFREAGLGPLIGKRSWGGVVGITNRGQLIDGGVVNVPESGFASKTGEWIIEGYGVDPDIEVDNDPPSVIAGKDPQLERAIAEVMGKLKQPVKLPAKPAPPVKTIDSRRTSKATEQGNN